jgi:hypothetical protein
MAGGYMLRENESFSPQAMRRNHVSFRVQLCALTNGFTSADAGTKFGTFTLT